MRKTLPIRKKNAGQQGYALVLVVFLLALVVVSLATVTPNILVNGRRDKEEEMIWRGKQYVRGVRLFVRYYQMHGGQTKFPTSMDDLTKNKVGIRFMRQAYKDPVNTVDGSWRFIYVGPNGQLIGSLKQRPLGQGLGSSSGSSSAFGSMFGNSGQSGTGQGSAFGNSSFGNSSSGNSSFGNSFSNGAQNLAAAGQAAAAAAAEAQNADNGDATPQAIAAADVNLDIVGGNIIGVGSKVNEKSIIWYDKAKNYRQFEFVWDPAKEPVNGGSNAGVVGVPGQTPLNGASSPFGGSSTGNNNGQGQSTGVVTGNPNTGTATPPPQQ